MELLVRGLLAPGLRLLLAEPPEALLPLPLLLVKVDRGPLLLLEVLRNMVVVVVLEHPPHQHQTREDLPCMAQVEVVPGVGSQQRMLALMDLLGAQLDPIPHRRGAVRLGPGLMALLAGMPLLPHPLSTAEVVEAVVLGILLEQVEPVAMVGIRVGVVDPVREGPLLAVRGAEGHMVV